MTRVVDYYMHPVSPWTFLGHRTLREMLTRHGAQVRIKPFDLGARVFPISGGVPLPKRAPQRQAYRLIELPRWAALRGEPLVLQPKFFPAPGDEACRMIIAADQAHGIDAAMTLAGAVMRAVWCEERNMGDAATLRAIVGECSLDADALTSSSAQAQAQAAFDTYTQEAIDRGVFGVPWYIYRDEPFWGQDRLDFLDRALARG